MKSKDIARQSARLEHLRRRLHRAKRELRGMPAEIGDSLHLAMVQLSHAVEALDREAGAQQRRELGGE